MVKVTLEVPESLVGDIYIAVGHVLDSGGDDADQGAEQAAHTERSESDLAAEEA